MLEKLSKLSYIIIEEKNKEKFSRDLEDIIKHIDKLKEVIVDGIEPLYFPNEDRFLKLREDIVKNSITNEEALKNAKMKKEKLFVIKRVLDEENI